MTSSATLKAQTALSLVDRSKAFLRKFPAAHMNSTLLRKIYRLHGVKKKKLRWYKVPKGRDGTVTTLELARLKRQLTMAKNDGYRIIYIDETCFTRKTVTDTEWARPKENMRVDEAKLNEPTLALLSGVSMERGQEHFMIFRKSVDIKKFKEYLR